MIHCTLESFFEWIVKDAYKTYPTDHLYCSQCIDPKKYSCFRGMTFEQAQKEALKYNLDLHHNTEHDHFGEHPWEFSVIETK